jgi:hypothetical protein
MSQNEKERIGTCSICSNIGKLSFEHLPPESAFNNKPIYTQDFERLFDNKSYLYLKKSVSQRGFGRYSLCVTCNNNTGSWYAKDYLSFASQSLEFINQQKGEFVISGEYILSPLSILKQIVSMFMSINHNSQLNNDHLLVKFILDKENQCLPEKYRVYMYSNMSSVKRMLELQTVFVDMKNYYFSEFNFSPFGFVFTVDSEKPNEYLIDITHFKEFKYNQSVKLSINSANLEVSKPWPGFYDNLEPK